VCREVVAKRGENILVLAAVAEVFDRRRLGFVPVARDGAELEELRREVAKRDLFDRGVDDLVGHRVPHLSDDRFRVGGKRNVMNGRWERGIVRDVAVVEVEQLLVGVCEPVHRRARVAELARSGAGLSGEQHDVSRRCAASEDRVEAGDAERKGSTYPVWGHRPA